MQIGEIGAFLDKANSIWEMFCALTRHAPNQILFEQVELPSSVGPRTIRGVSRQQTLGSVSKIAQFLCSLGVGPEARVAILSATRPEWLLADLAILACGAVSVSVYQSLPAAEVGYILFDSNAQVVFAENEEQLAKLLDLMSSGCLIPATEEREEQRVAFEFKRIICFEPKKEIGISAPEGLVSYLPEILEGMDASSDFVANIDREQLASLVYTSGTTGPPKGVMQTHGNHLANVRQALQGELVSEGQSIMLFLPLAHSFARLMAYVGALTHCSLKFPAVVDHKTSKVHNDSLRADIAAAGANIVPVVPRILEKMRDGLVHVARQSSLMGKLLSLTLWAAHARSHARQEGAKPTLIVQLIFFLTAFVRRKIKRGLFGAHFSYAVSGGAKLNPEVCKFFDGLGVEVLEGYGLTETCVATNANKPGRKKFGTVGPVLAPDIRVKIASDGEILFAGPNIAKGYLGRKSASAAAWDSEGWFHTGDLGSIDSDGFLRIEGRKKEILVTSYGKNIAPEPIENRLKNSPYISHAMLVGDGRAFCVALLTLEMPGVQSWAKTQGLQMSPDLTRSARINELINAEVEKVNSSLASFETVKKFVVLAEDFSVENGLLTPTLKVKRREVLKRYAAEIEELYRELSN